MRVLITGCQGKVGSVTTRAFTDAGHDVVGIDVLRGVYDAPAAGDKFPAQYMQCDLAEAGGVFAIVARYKPDAVVHIAAIPDPTHNPPHVVFSTNINSTFNVVEACQKLGVPRLVNISSEHVPGFFSSPGSDPWGARQVGPGLGLPAYCPVDEGHPVAPQNPYALSKAFGEQLCDAACRRSPDISIVSIRPSWCQDERNVERNLGPLVRDLTLPNDGMWSYICITDLAEAILLAAVTPGIQGHEVIYIAAEDNIGGRDLAASVKAHYGDGVPVRAPLPRVDASGISCAKAAGLIGWTPKMTWRDYLDGEGHLLPKWK